MKNVLNKISTVLPAHFLNQVQLGKENHLHCIKRVYKYVLQNNLKKIFSNVGIR